MRSKPFKDYFAKAVLAGFAAFDKGMRLNAETEQLSRLTSPSAKIGTS